MPGCAPAPHSSQKGQKLDSPQVCLSLPGLDTEPPNPQEGPARWEVVLGDEGHLPDQPDLGAPLLWPELSWLKPRWLAALCEAADGDPCLSGRKEAVKIAWLIPVCSPGGPLSRGGGPRGSRKLCTEPRVNPSLSEGAVHPGTSLVAQLVKNPPAMRETPVPFLGQEDPLENG